MYIPSFNEQTDAALLHALIRQNPLGTWSVIVEGEIVTNHLPFLLREKDDGALMLVAHVARANPIWRQLPGSGNSVVVFHGEQAYISPSSYPSKLEHGKVVPTWNYTVVHVRGLARTREEPEWLMSHLNELTDNFEKELAPAWRVSDAPADFVDKLRQAIVGIEIPVASLTGKWKLGQNRPEQDQLGMLEALRLRGDENATGLAERLARHRDRG